MVREAATHKMADSRMMTNTGQNIERPSQPDDDALMTNPSLSESNLDHDRLHPSIRPPTPLPVKKLFVLCIMRLSEPVSFTVIFPFINKMIEDLAITSDRTQVGTYAGLIESLFALAQLSTVLFWGRLSDRIGRKPVLISGLMGLSIGMIAFGLQKSLIGLIIARSFAGAMNGNIAVVKSALSEITDETNKARAFPLLPICYALGLTIGPAIGGYAAEPAQQYPNSIFATWSIFSTYPYFLPCLLSGSLNLLALLVGFFFLDETLPSKIAERKYLRLPNDEDYENREEVDQVPTLKDLLNNHLVTLLISFGFMAFENSAWMALVPLFSYTRDEDGGLGLSLGEIGMTLSSNGVVVLLVQSLMFPRLHGRFGAVVLYRWARLASPITFLALPFVRVFSRLFSDRSTSNSVAIAGMFILITIRSLGNTGLVCMNLLINDSAPNHASLGTINGLGQSVASFSRAISPFFVGKIFSISSAGGKSKDYSLIQKNLIWYFLVIISVLGYSTCWMIKEKRKVSMKPKQARLEPSVLGMNGPGGGADEHQRLLAAQPEPRGPQYGL